MDIYKITCLINGKVYIGKEEKYNKSYYGSGNFIKLAIKKYGKSNFNKVIICVCSSIEELNEKEKFYIEFFNSRNKDVGYNISAGGDGGPLFKGHHHSAKSKKRMKEKRKKFVGCLSSMFGKHHSEETKRKFSLSRKGKQCGSKNGMFGKHHSKKSKLKMARPHFGEKNGMFGKHHSEESKEKIKQKLLGDKNPFYNKKHSEQVKSIIRSKKLNGKNFPTKEQFENIYRNNTNDFAAKYFNVHRTTISKWQRYFNVSLKRKKQF